jgi:hypothetical protein
MSYPACPCSQPLYHLPTDQSAVDGHKLVRSALNSDIFNKEDRQRQEEKQEDEDCKDNEGSRQPQQEVKEDVAAALMTGKIGGTYLSSKKDESLGLGYHDSSPEPSHDKLRSYSDSCSDDGFSNDDGRPVLLSGSGNDHPHPITAQCTRSASTILSRGLPTNIDHAPRLIGALSSLTPHWFKVQKSPQSLVPRVNCIAGTLNATNHGYRDVICCCNHGLSSSHILPTLTEVTFRLHPTRCCSFTAVVR